MSKTFNNSISTRPFCTHKAKGGALYISLLLCISVGVILLLIILMSEYNQRSVAILHETARFHYNLRSGMSIARSAYFSPSQNNQWFKCFSGADSLKISRRPWGAFYALGVETKLGERSLYSCALYGSTLPADTALLLTECNRQLTINGPVQFNGKCFLPKYRKLSGKQGPENELKNIFNSPAVMPQLHESVRRNTNEQLIVTSEDSVLTTLPGTFARSFRRSTAVFNLTDSRISGCHLNGNIKLIGERIEVDSSCHFKDILLVCRQVKFNRGFQGVVHVIAADSILTAPGCVFNYPSSFVLSVQDVPEHTTKTIIFSDSVKFSGAVIAYSDDKGHQPVSVQLCGSTAISGIIFSGGSIHVAGHIDGTVIAEKLRVITPSAVVENLLMPCQINSRRLAKIIAVPALFTSYSPLNCATALE